MKKLNKNLVGHVVIGNSDFHVCGYGNQNKVLVQSGTGEPMKEYFTYVNAKGVYFNYKGKRFYLPTLN